MTLWPLGAFGRHLTLRLAMYAAALALAGLALFAAFDLVESANRGLDFEASLRRIADRLPSVGLRIAKIALVLGGLAAGHESLRRGELLAWSFGGGHPAALFSAALAVGGSSAVLAAVAPPRPVPAEPSPWRRIGPDLVRWSPPRGDRIDFAEGLTVHEGRLTRRWHARGLRFDGRQWRPESILVRRFEDGGLRTLRTGPAPLRLTPAELRAGDGAISVFPRWATPVGWSVAAALGLGLALLLGAQASPLSVLSAGLGTGLVLYLVDEIALGLHEVALLRPAAAALLSAATPVAATVAVWATALRRGIRD